MVSAENYDAVKAVVDNFAAGGADDFQPEDVFARLGSTLPIGEVKGALRQIWQREGGIYPVALMDGLWTFGEKPFPEAPRRNPIGR